MSNYCRKSKDFINWLKGYEKFKLNDNIYLNEEIE
jgi:hypothetical protein